MAILTDSSGSIREQDPLKQGLKPNRIKNFLWYCSDSRARSIKTRIETKI